MGGSAELASIVVTTFGNETAYTERCLERIAAFKKCGPEVIVVLHDPSELLHGYLEYCSRSGLIDQLVHAAPDHGHLRGVNLGMSKASRSVLINVNIDVEISLYVIDHCVRKLLDCPRTGAIGWYYDWGAFHPGSFWEGDTLAFSVRYEDSYGKVRGRLDEEHQVNIKRAWW